MHRLPGQVSVMRSNVLILITIKTIDLLPRFVLSDCMQSERLLLSLLDPVPPFRYDELRLFCSRPMALHESIFVFRTSPNERIRPTQDQLAAFLKTAVKEDGRGLHVTDLAKYSRLLKDIELFEQRRSSGEPRPDLGEFLFYGVLANSRFAVQSLLSAIVDFKYHFQALTAPDFANPMAFIRSAEKDMTRLSTKKIADVLRMKRLQEMIEERKKIVAGLKKRWMEPAAELRHITMYIKDNLAGVEKLCEAAIVIIAELDIARTREHQLVEDLKTYFKDRLKEALRRGTVTKQDLESAREEAEMLSLELSILIREDVDALTALYEAVRDHVKKIGVDLVFLLAELGGKKGSSITASTDIFKQIEQSLISLISAYRFELQPRTTHTDTEHDAVIRDKRWEMLSYLFEEVRKERRNEHERRLIPDRRKAADPAYKGPERRSDPSRRTGKTRRR